MSISYSNAILNEGIIQIEDKIFELSEKTSADFVLTSPVREVTLFDRLRTSSRRPYDFLELGIFVCNNLSNLVLDQRYAHDVIDSADNNKGKLFILFF